MSIIETKAAKEGQSDLDGKAATRVAYHESDVSSHPLYSQRAPTAHFRLIKINWIIIMNSGEKKCVCFCRNENRVD